jgi:ABC-type cobalamin/Fe3+-siderophores transport system ATPase subunit
MRFKRFIISNYRAITGPLEIRISKGSLIPIIGVNESGKTTILHAIFAFDYFNDDSNDGGRHLKDVSNLYQSSSPAATVEAEIETSPTELKKIFAECQSEDSANKETYEELIRRKKLPSKLNVRRTITTRKYAIVTEYFGNPTISDRICQTMMRYLPYILYFDDFRDKIAEKIEIPLIQNESEGEWFEILEQLFKQTDSSFSLYDLPKLEIRQRKTVLSKVQRHLNATLTREWQSFRLDDRDALKIHIEFEQKEFSHSPPDKTSSPQTPSQQSVATKPPTVLTAPQVKNYVKLEVVETDKAGDEHFFFISDRSKGFYWFFNFVMKLEFNPKVNSDSNNSIYLLDEPGSYLHAYAQRKLCSKLRQIAEKNDVLYCTHSHYLLDPAIIPIKNVMIADKDGNGKITLTRMIDHHDATKDNRSALQPLLDALEVRPYALDVIHAQATIITEGIYDYFCLELFRGSRAVCILPCRGAESINFYIPLMIAWQLEFRALWDNDPEGRKWHARASELFGLQIAERCLRLLPFGEPNSRWIMQSLFEGEDLSRLRQQLGLAQESSFERTILALFYSSAKEAMIEGIGAVTKKRFDDLFQALSL